MSIQRNKLNIGKARRRVQIRSALLLTLVACALSALCRLVAPLFGQGAALVLEMLCTILAFGGTAYLGLCVLDGDHRRILPLRKLRREQILFLSLTGAFAVCPASLAADLVDALFGLRETASPAVLSSGLFTARLLKSVLIVPVCEEIFFRGYLLYGARRAGDVRASMLSALCFALSHAISPGTFAAHALVGALLCALTLKTGSLLSPMLVHAAYNAALLLLSHMGLGALVSGWSMIACALRLAGCAAFAAALRRVYLAGPAGGAFALWTGEKLTRREAALLAGCALLLFTALIMGG